MAEHRRTSAEVAAALRVAFGEYRFDGGARQLWRGDEEIRLTPRASALLAALAERSTEVVTKQELIDRLWDGKAVGDDALTSCVQELRRALGDDPRHPRVIETRYRLLLAAAPMEEAPPTLPDKASIAAGRSGCSGGLALTDRPSLAKHCRPRKFGLSKEGTSA